MAVHEIETYLGGVKVYKQCITIHYLILALMLLQRDLVHGKDGFNFHFRSNATFTGYNCSTSCLQFGPKSSLLDCAAACGIEPTCTCFFYNRVKGTCCGMTELIVSPTTASCTPDSDFVYYTQNGT